MKIEKLKKKKVNLFIYELDTAILDFNTISNSIEKYSNEILNPLVDNQYVTFQLVYKLSDNTFRTLGFV